MKKRHKENLLRLADYLEQNVADEEIEMLTYCQGASGRFINNCGSVYCLLGHAGVCFQGDYESENYAMLSFELFGISEYSE